MRKPHILIAGAGIGGLSAALALLHAGFQVSIFEQAKTFVSLGAGIQISPNAVRVLNELGVTEGLTDIGVKIESVEARSGDKGEPLFSIPLGADCLKKYGSPYYSIHRADLHQLLLDAVQAYDSQTIHLGVNCIGVEQSEKEVELELEDGSLMQGDVLIACDGVHSLIRESITSTVAQFTGHVAWRGLVPVDRLDASFKQAKTGLWIGEKRHFVHYPVQSGRFINYVAVIEQADWVQPRWNEQGRREQLLADFKDWHPVLHSLIKASDECYKWALLDHKPLKHWTNKRVTLLGDAAHPMLPFLAQGGAMAIEDAWVLADCLKQAVASNQDLMAALIKYEKIRIPRTRRVQLASRANGRKFHMTGSLSRLRNKILALTDRFSPDLLQSQLNWIYGHNVIAKNKKV